MANAFLSLVTSLSLESRYTLAQDTQFYQGPANAFVRLFKTSGGVNDDIRGEKWIALCQSTVFLNSIWLRVD
jgi:hypothetical protein